MAHALAGKPVQEQDIIDVQTIVDAYFDNVPDMTNPTQLVSFGTSGHRGTSVDGTFIWSLLHNQFVMVVNNLVLLVQYS